LTIQTDRQVPPPAHDFRPDRKFHIPSHRSLVKAEGLRKNSGKDLPQAVVVPAQRLDGTLRHAAGVARMAGCPLVIVCSGRSAPGTLTPQQAIDQLADVPVPPWVVAVSLSSSNALAELNLTTSRFNLAADPRGDTADKRNLAIMLARQMGWETVLFLDDDVTGVHRPELDRMSQLMAQKNSQGSSLKAVGWAFQSCADNSVVCHAYRNSGGPQDTFIGAGALFIRCDPQAGVSFFPRVYNEDWMFLLDSVVTGRVALAGNLDQAEYDPFKDPARAANEEFGDVLAEGLYSLLHQSTARSEDSTDQGAAMMDLIWEKGTDPAWWRLIIGRRRKLIAVTEKRLRSARQTRKAMFHSLAAARETLRDSWSIKLAEYVTAWRNDFDAWNKALANIPSRPASAVADRDHLAIELIMSELGLIDPKWINAPAHPRLTAAQYPAQPDRPTSDLLLSAAS
jgi:hypothetical protein